MAVKVDLRAGRYDWLINEGDDSDLTIVWTSNGVAASEGGTLLDVGLAANWWAGVWASVDDASSGATRLVTPTMTVPGSGTTKAALTSAQLVTLGNGTFFWAQVRLAPRKTFAVGTLNVNTGVQP